MYLIHGKIFKNSVFHILMELLKETLRILRSYGVKPSRRLSQNFVVDKHLLETIISYASPSISDDVLDVGAGLGTLTARLAEKAGKVIAVEIDKRLVKVLRDRFKHYGNVEVIHGDFLNLDVKASIIVGNIPYHISTPILFKILNMRFKRAVLTLQKEVAERLIAKPGSKDYGRLTVSTNIRANIEIIDTYPPESFYPPPEVFHSLVLLTPKDKIEVNLELLDNLLIKLFSQRNRIAKTVLRKTLINDFGLDKGMESFKAIVESIPENKRVYQLTIDEIISICNRLKQ
ncbi:MAG: 16S rRNA (adenine(1518)-N(6)/adenine(1519)-N(6))-dimethyltransferase RsmA [Candidatus Methanomethylicia archaeon]